LILTTEEYARGFIDFDAVLPEGCTVELWTRTSDQPTEEVEWTGPYSDPRGAKVLSSAKPYMQLRVGLRRGEDPTKTPILSKVRWERDGKTFIWPNRSGFFYEVPERFILGRDYGVSYRLAFQPQRAGWPEPFVIVGQRARIRFWKGGIKGHEISGFRYAEPTPEGTFSVEGELAEIEAGGDILEVLVTVPGNNDERTREVAKSQVESIVGLLALCFGEQILGKPVFADFYFSGATGEQGDIPVPVKHLLEVSVDRDVATLADEALAGLHNLTISAPIGMALRWYAAGLGSESPVDAFISFFVGLEALSSSYFASIDPKPVRKEYVQLKEYFVNTQPAINSKLKEIVLDRIADFPLTMKFDAYWKTRFGRVTQESRKFYNLNRLRSKLLHGGVRWVTLQQVNVGRTLLEKLLAKEFGLEDLMDRRQSGPTLLEFALTYVTMRSHQTLA
jgi:hypothetical protein